MYKKIVGIFIIMFLTTSLINAVNGTNNFLNEESKTVTLIYKQNFLISQNGVILDQELDENNKGYSIIRIWGSDYEMGYAQAELLGDYIVQIVNENKDYLGNDYNSVREVISDAIWMPPGLEDEFDGMVDCLAVTHSSENIDALDLKVLNTIGDWAYSGCRSHTCWGRYVTSPIKTLSTFRLDSPTIYPAANHHVLYARDPDDGSPRWINLAWPGYVLTMTGVNEFGTLISNNDYQSSNSDFCANRMPRMVAFRYAMTFATDSDVSSHLSSVYNELQKYELMTGTFLSYYASEGNAGVLTCNPYESGPDFYDLRVPQESWHHGEAMICTNDWTDGTYTPDDEDFGADNFYGDESSKTLESHWDILHHDGAGSRGLHQLSLAYRNREDMTIWFDGRISNIGKKTPRLEWEWEDLFNAEPPSIPVIKGETNGKNGNEYEYSFTSTDAQGHDIYYHINWGDNSTEEVVGPNSSGDTVTAKHTWIEEGAYLIRAKARNINGLESNWATLEINMPKLKQYKNNFLEFINQWILHRFTIFEKILNQII
jgi:hypothetical protein